MRTLNTQHPFWQSLINSHLATIDLGDIPESLHDMIVSDIDGYSTQPLERWRINFEEVVYHVFKDGDGIPWLVYELPEEPKGRFAATVSGAMGGELELFPSLEEALQTTFMDWFPEGTQYDEVEEEGNVISLYKHGLILIKDWYVPKSN